METPQKSTSTYIHHMHVQINVTSVYCVLKFHIRSLVLQSPTTQITPFQTRYLRLRWLHRWRCWWLHIELSIQLSNLTDLRSGLVLVEMTGAQWQGRSVEGSDPRQHPSYIFFWGEEVDRHSHG